MFQVWKTALRRFHSIFYSAVERIIEIYKNV